MAARKIEGEGGEENGGSMTEVFLESYRKQGVN
jgi:hypothetical protein